MNPAVIDSYGWAMAEVYGACTDKILVNLAKYFPYLKAGDEIKGSFEYQARMLAQMGKVDRETVQIIIDHLNGADEALRNALTEAILQGLKDEEPKLRRAAERGLLSGGGVPELSPNQMQAFKSYYRQSADKLNLVNTVMLESTEAAYRSTVADVAAKIQRTQSILNIGTGEVVTGVSSYNSAVRSAVRSMVNNGLTGFVDHGGHRWSPEAYVAMDVKTTMMNTSRAAVFERNEEYGNDLYQVSSHNGARPLCYPWQGKILSNSGRTGTTTDLYGNEIQIHSESEVESFRYGGGLFGVNCGHFPMVFIPTFSTIKGEPQDAEDNARTYAESQEQRALERKLREERRDLEVMKAQGASPEEIKAQKERIRAASNEIDEFCDRTGRTRKKGREGTPVNATWPDGTGGKVTRYNGDYIDTNQVPPPKGAYTPPPPINPLNVAPQATQPPAPVVQSKAKSKLATEILPNSGIASVPVEKWDHAPTTQEIISEIGGADRTRGSCASVSLAYVGNKAGYKVHDFRGGDSMDWFSTKTNTQKIVELPEINGKVITGKNEIKIANQLLSGMEQGKEYWLGIGRHASIVRDFNGKRQYLELQSSLSNGWHDLDDYVLRWRFGCVNRRSYDLPARMMEVDKLTKSDDFIEILKYINTPVTEQKKGAGGGIK